MRYDTHTHTHTYIYIYIYIYIYAIRRLKVKNARQARTGRDMVKSSSPNPSSTWLIFLFPRTHASPQTCQHSASSVLAVRITVVAALSHCLCSESPCVGCHWLAHPPSLYVLSSTPHSRINTDGICEWQWELKSDVSVWRETYTVNVQCSVQYTLLLLYLMLIMSYCSRFQWPRGLRRRSTASSLLRLWVRIPPGAWTYVCCECCVLSGRGLCYGLNTCPEHYFFNQL